MILFLIRHAESANNALAQKVNQEKLGAKTYWAERYTDPPLTKLGEQQARRLADYFAKFGLDEEGPHREGSYGFDKIYASPMLRTLQTIQPSAERMKWQPEIWLDVYEDGGIFGGHPEQADSITEEPGLTRAEVMEKFPGYHIPEDFREEGWWNRGFESYKECNTRAIQVAQTLKQWGREGASEGAKRVAVISHGTFLDCLLKALLGYDNTRANSDNEELEGGFYHRHYNTGITRVDFLDNGFLVLRYFNRVEHLNADEYSG